MITRRERSAVILPKLETGRLLTTAAVMCRIEEDERFGEFVASSLERYKECDWGDTCAEDAEMNDNAVVDGDRIIALYVFKDEEGNSEDIWIITEADRSATTVLFPHEY